MSPDDSVCLSCLMTPSLRRRIRDLAADYGVSAQILGGWFLVCRLCEEEGEGAEPPTLAEFADQLGVNDQYVYLMRADNGVFKIGKSYSPHERLKAMRTHSPIRIELAHTILVPCMKTAEKALHAMFKSRRSHGEWFNLTAGDVRQFKRLTPADLCPALAAGGVA